MTIDDHDRFSERGDHDAAASRNSLSLTKFDAEDYRACLDGLELTDAQTIELQRIVWNMMRMCLEMNVPAESWGQIVGLITENTEEDSTDIS